MVIFLYGASWCPSCRNARDFLDKHSVQYNYMDVDTKGGMEEFIRENKGKSIPLLKVDGEYIIGFSPQRYQELLDL